MFRSVMPSTRTSERLLVAMAADAADAARRARSGERRGGTVSEHDLRLALHD